MKPRFLSAVLLTCALLAPSVSHATAATLLPFNGSAGKLVKLHLWSCLRAPATPPNGPLWWFYPSKTGDIVELVADSSVPYVAFTNVTYVQSLTQIAGGTPQKPEHPVPPSWAEVFKQLPTGLTLTLRDGTVVGEISKIVTVDNTHVVVITPASPNPQHVALTSICFAVEHWEK